MKRYVSRCALGAITAMMLLGGMAAVARAATFKGIVVHHNKRGHSFVVANSSGRLFAVHARRSPRLGSSVVVTAKRLHDGTYKLQRVRRTGHAHHARVRGVVSFVNRRAGTFTVSAPGVSMLVIRAHRRGARAADSMPAVGSDVVASGTVDDQGDLEAENVQDVGHDTNGFDVEGVVLSVDPSARTITVSSDDDDQSGGSIVVSVPAGLDLSQFTQGEEVELEVQPTGPGTATLLGSANDDNAQSADDQGDQQGDNPGDENGGGDGGSHEGGSSEGGSSGSSGSDSSGGHSG